MRLQYTTQKFIDPTNKHVLTPSAFEAWLADSGAWPSAQYWDIPDITLSDRPVSITLPVGATYGYINGTFYNQSISLRVCFFIEPGENFSPYVEKLQMVAQYILRVDWAHTLQIGGRSWKSRASSYLTRSRYNFGTNSVYDGGRTDLALAQALEPTYTGDELNEETDGYGYVLEVIVEKAGTTIFESKVYNREVWVCHTPFSGTSVTDALNGIAAMSGRTQITYYTGPNDTGTTVDFTIAAVYLVPRAYIPAYMDETDLDVYPLYHSAPYDAFYPVMSANTVINKITRNVSLDNARFDYVLGNGALEIKLQPTARTSLELNFRATFSPAYGFQIDVNIDAETYDLTPYTRVPYSFIDQNQVSAMGTERVLGMATTAISIGVGVASQNPVAIAGGLINGARQTITTPSGAPARSMAGDCFRQRIGDGWGLLWLLTYNRDPQTVIANRSRGPNCATKISGNEVETALLSWNDSVTPHVCYLEGDVRLYNTATYWASLFSAYADRIEKLIEDGVYIWTNKDYYMGDLFA